MNLETIYHVEKFSQNQLDDVNLLLEHGWVLLQIGQTNFRYDVHDFAVGADKIFILGASKTVFEDFNLELYQFNKDVERAANNLAFRINRAKEDKEREKRLGLYSDVFEILDDDLPF